MTITPIAGTGAFCRIWDIDFLIGDATTGNIAHTLGIAPPIVHFARTAMAAAYATGALDNQAVSTIDATNLVVTKTGAVGTSSIRLVARYPHSINND